MPAAADHMHEPLDLVIRDFGPIAEATIRLRPLTVFIGPSGSGKTFAAAALYSVARAGTTVLSGMSESSLFVGYNARAKALVDELAAQFQADWVRLLANPATKEAANKDVAHWVLRGIDLFGQHVANASLSSCKTLLRAETDADVQRFDSPGLPAFGLFPPGTSLKRSQSGAVVTANLFFSKTSPTLDMDWALAWAAERNLFVGDSLPPEQMGHLWAVALFSRFARTLQERFGPLPLYMPAGRTGLVEAAIPVITGALAAGGRLEMAGPILEFLTVLPQAMQAPDGELAPVVDEIETLLHGGQIGPRAGLGPVPDLVLHSNGHQIPMVRASASVSELAAVTFILRRLGKKNALVVIEEPEAHLHPAKQILLARALARLVRAGVRLVITTHSEFLIDTLGWLIRGTELGEPTRPAIADGERLHPDEVGVYRFHEREAGGGYTATEVPFDPQEGFDRGEFLDIAGDLFNRHADVGRRQRAHEKPE